MKNSLTLNQKSRVWSRKWLHTLNRNKYLLSMLIPALVLLLVFVYLPMGGNIIAFKKYSFRKGIFGSDWVGFKYFEQMWGQRLFWRAFKNQLVISFFMLLTGFPFPIVIALLLNEIRGARLRRTLQTAYTFPYFLSWIVISGVVTGFLTGNGLVNQLQALLHQPSNRILLDGDQFRILLYVTNIWKSSGWNAIMYLAALAAINPELYEAASLDGANRWQQTVHITWPGIASTAAVLLVLQCGGVMSMGYDQVLNMYNQTVYAKADIIDTFIYREYLAKGTNFSLAAAVGLFKSVINIVLLLLSNMVVKKMGQEGVI